MKKNRLMMMLLNSIFVKKEGVLRGIHLKERKGRGFEKGDQRMG